MAGAIFSHHIVVRGRTVRVFKLRRMRWRLRSVSEITPQICRRWVPYVLESEDFGRISFTVGWRLISDYPPCVNFASPPVRGGRPILELFSSGRLGRATDATACKSKGEAM